MTRFAKLKALLQKLAQLEQSFWGKAGSGILIICLEDNSTLLLKRSSMVREPGTWGIAGGAIEEREQSLPSALREATEELGSLPNFHDLINQISYKQDNFEYTTFIYSISLKEKERWTSTIKLNWENDQYKWFPLNALPANLHFGLEFIKQYYHDQDEDLFDQPKGEFDWLIKEIKQFQNIIPKDIISEIISLIKQQNKEELNKKLKTIQKFFLAKKDIANYRKTKDLIDKLEPHKESFEYREPKQELSKYDKYLYHGTNPTDAYSVLKSGVFLKGTSFNKLSLTSDPAIAAKFGSVVFVFDGQKIQKRQARKIRYYPEKEHARLFADPEKSSEHYEDSPRPKHYEVYRYEKEWSLKLPFQFSDDELIKLIIYADKSSDLNSPKRIKALLETVTEKPIELAFVPSHFQYGVSDFREEEGLVTKDIKFHVFNDLVQPIEEYRKEANLAIKEIKKELIDRYGPEYIEERLKSDTLVKAITSFYFRIGPMIDKFNEQKYSEWDLEEFKKFFQVMDYDYQYLKKYSYEKSIANLIPLVERIIKAKNLILKSFYQSFLSSEESYLNMIENYSSYRHAGFRDEIFRWANDHIDQIISIVRKNNLDHHNTYGGKFAIIDDILKALNNVVAIPDDIWKKFTIELLDNDNLHKMPENRLRNIYQNNSDFTWKAEEIEQYRLPYTKSENVSVIKTIMEIVDPKVVD